MESFRRAVSLAPNDAGTYQSAYNFATPQWGGSRAQRKEIYELSVKHNPGAAWTTHLRDSWAKDLNRFWRFDNL